MFKLRMKWNRHVRKFNRSQNHALCSAFVAFTNFVSKSVHSQEFQTITIDLNKETVRGSNPGKSVEVIEEIVRCTSLSHPLLAVGQTSRLKCLKLKTTKSKKVLSPNKQTISLQKFPSTHSMLSISVSTKFRSRVYKILHGKHRFFQDSCKENAFHENGSWRNRCFPCNILYSLSSSIARI